MRVHQSNTRYTAKVNKICSKCRIEKPVTEFSPRKDGKGGGHQSWCKLCNKSRYHSNQEYRESVLTRSNLRNQKTRIDLREKINGIKQGSSCNDCGGTFPPYVMDFHHVDSDKEFTVARAANVGYSWSRIQREISKCVLLCSNCHRIRHHGPLAE